MSVYAHRLMACVPNRNWRWRQSTHMVADTEAELHAFAKRIGLKREWFQNHRRLPHYDLTPMKFEQARRMGLVLMSRKVFWRRFLKERV